MHKYCSYTIIVTNNILHSSTAMEYEDLLDRDFEGGLPPPPQRRSGLPLLPPVLPPPLLGPPPPAGEHMRKPAQWRRWPAVNWIGCRGARGSTWTGRGGGGGGGGGGGEGGGEIEGAPRPKRAEAEATAALARSGKM